MKPTIREVIVVEGRYDRNTLSQVVDATIVETNGFGIFNDREKLVFFRRLAERRGLILFTDPDGAGFVIRNYLKGALPRERIKQAYIPDVYGKEHRKKVGGKEGKLGVEGMPPQIILDALHRCGATFIGEEQTPNRAGITKADLLDRGLIGSDSTEKRLAFLRDHGLPERMTSNAMLEAINLLMTKDEWENI